MLCCFRGCTGSNNTNESPVIYEKEQAVLNYLSLLGLVENGEITKANGTQANEKKVKTEDWEKAVNNLLEAFKGDIEEIAKDHRIKQLRPEKRAELLEKALELKAEQS